MNNVRIVPFSRPKPTDSTVDSIWYTLSVRHSLAVENRKRLDSQAGVLSNLLSIFESEQGVFDRQYRRYRQIVRSVRAVD